MRRNFSPCVIFLTSALFLTAGYTANAQSLSVYMSGPAANDTEYNAGQGIIGTSFEASDGFTTTGVYSAPVTVAGFATYNFGVTNRAGIEVDDQYGNNTGQYLGVGNSWNGGAGNQSVTVNFATAVRYFGIAWTAGDGGNTMAFYNGNTLLATYVTGNTTTFLNTHSSFQSSDGLQTYNASSYYGKPTTGQNASEPYTYLNFFASGVTFDRVVLGNLTNSGFEQDNHRTSTQTLAPRGAFVLVETLAVVPEADSGTLLALALTGSALVGVIRRRLRK